MEGESQLSGDDVVRWRHHQQIRHLLAFRIRVLFLLTGNRLTHDARAPMAMPRQIRFGSGEPARAWSPAWDMVAADPCNGFQPG